MATNLTMTITFDDGAITDANAAIMGAEITAMLSDRYQDDSRVAGIDVDYATEAITVAIT